jgi:hypothetical protein
MEGLAIQNTLAYVTIVLIAQLRLKSAEGRNSANQLAFNNCRVNITTHNYLACANLVNSEKHTSSTKCSFSYSCKKFYIAEPRPRAVKKSYRCVGAHFLWTTHIDSRVQSLSSFKKIP